MMRNQNIDTPPECSVLREAQQRLNMNGPEIALATGLSLGLVHIALSGVRYRDGKPRAVNPTDKTLVLISHALGVTPEQLTAVGRSRAAQMLADVAADDERERPLPADYADTKAAIAARAALVKQMLAVFTDEELRLELDRREDDVKAEYDRQVRAELVADLKSDLGVL